MPENQTCPTMRVILKENGQEVIINIEDFSDEKHERAGRPKLKGALGEGEKKAAK